MIPNIANLNKREKAVFSLAAFVIVLKLSFDLILTPYLRGLDIRDKEILHLKNKLAKAKRVAARKAVIEKDFLSFASVFKEGEEMSPEQQTARILIELERAGTKSGVNINDIKPRAIKNLEYYSEFVVELRLEAGIREIADFLYQLQRSPELLRIEKFELNIHPTNSTLLYGYLEIHKILF